ncbi:energy transducer TonB [Pirellulaceae bacterium]|nr:energy transducer TonB [Pirellulaceae bacterium]
MAIGGLSNSQTEVTVGSIQQGESSIAIQLLAATRPPEESFLGEQEYTEQDTAIDRQEPKNLKQLDSKLEQQETPVSDSKLIRQQAVQIVEVVEEVLSQRTSEYESNTLGEEKVDIPTEPGSLLPARAIALKANVSETAPVQVKAARVTNGSLNSQPDKPVIQRPESSSTKDQEQLTTKPLSRDRSVVDLELELERMIADKPPRKGNSDSDIIVEPMDGANSAPSLDSRNPLNRPPVFPQDLVSKGVSGTVKLEVIVLPSGKVKSTRVIFSTGSEKLDQLAQEAVSKWQFNPGLTNGQTATKRVIVPITFKIEKQRAGVLQRK